MVSDQNDRYPAYFVSKLVSRFAGAGDQVIQAVSNYNLLSAYAIKRIDGSLSLLLINKGATNPLDAAVNLTGFVPQSAAAVYSYGIPQDEAARTGDGSPDLATTTFSGVSTSFVYQVAPYSAVVLSLAPVACPAAISPATQFFQYSGGDGQIAISADCTCSIFPAFTSFPSLGGNGSISVTMEERCAWQAVSNAGWITITSATAGIGSSTVSYFVAANPGVRGRKGTITIAGQTFSVKQKGR